MPKTSPHMVTPSLALKWSAAKKPSNAAGTARFTAPHASAISLALRRAPGRELPCATDGSASASPHSTVMEAAVLCTSTGARIPDAHTTAKSPLLALPIESSGTNASSGVTVARKA